jgi:hypothetical protein
MTAVDDVDQLNEQYHLASGEFLKGNPEPVKKLWSHREDVSLANPYGPPVRGWDEAAKTIEHASSLRSDGEFSGFEIVAKYVTAELAYVVQIKECEPRCSALPEPVFALARYHGPPTSGFPPRGGTLKIHSWYTAPPAFSVPSALPRASRVTLSYN